MPCNLYIYHLIYCSNLLCHICGEMKGREHKVKLINKFSSLPFIPELFPHV
jgi:hypothetical protein